MHLNPGAPTCDPSLLSSTLAMAAEAALGVSGPARAAPTTTATASGSLERSTAGSLASSLDAVRPQASLSASLEALSQMLVQQQV